MKCPLCNNDMIEGGLITNGVTVGWLPMEQFHKKGLTQIVHTGLRTVGKPNILLGQTKIPNAFFCKNCKKVVGIFDVTNHFDEFDN